MSNQAIIPSAVTAEELATLTTLAYDRHVYEAGALFGASTIALARAARSVTSVDPHTGYPHTKAPSTWPVYVENVLRAGVSARITSLRADFRTLRPDRSRHSVAWADLTGTYELTAAFLRDSRGIPIVAVHDYQRVGCEGATAAIDRWIARHKPRTVWRVNHIIVLEH